MLKSQSKSRLVGANSPGIIAPLGNCRIGFQPLPCYTSGHIGVIAKSGTLSYEAVGSLTRSGLGQSLCIGMGGDIVAGTNMVEALTMFENDKDTEAIVLCGEVGGRAEQDAAEWIKEYHRRVSNPKPIVAAVGGLRAPAGRIMGHAGAFASLGEDPAQVKHQALKDAGVTMVAHPSEFGPLLKNIFSEPGRDLGKITVSAEQKRGYHTAARGSQRRGYHTLRRTSFTANHTVGDRRRGLRVATDQAKRILSDLGTPVAEKQLEQADKRYLAITVDRSNRCPAIIASPTASPDQVFLRYKSFQYDYNNGPTEETIKAVFEHLDMDAAPPAAMATLGKLIHTLIDLFKDKEAFALATHLVGTQDGNLQVDWAEFGFDDSAYKSGRNGDIFALRDTSKEEPSEVEAEKHGIVYVKLDDPSATIGTLINGAGLAMNANDALAEYGAYPTNFLDTGGKATKETIKTSFALILNDSRVKVIFVNIFGGLTLCDMIAEGVMLAFKDLNMKVPVVVRLRGTNEELGQKMVCDLRPTRIIC